MVLLLQSERKSWGKLHLMKGHKGGTMKKKKLLFVLSISLVGIALAQDHKVGMAENRPDAKVFRWGELQAGDCHMVGATLVIHSNGTASFDSQVWTHTHGTDVWHSTIHLLGQGGELGKSGTNNSPGMPHNHDGPGNKVNFHYDFTFPATNFVRVTDAVEHGEC
jgi:hypothetical protein